MENKKKKSRRIDGKKKLILALDGILLIGVVVAAIILVKTLSGGDSAQSAFAAKKPGQQTVEMDANSGAESVSAQSTEGATVQSKPAQTAAVEGSKADAMKIDFTMLANDGIPAVAYLCCDDTEISYPVVQNMDNEYYMARNANGEKDENGAIFLDSRNSSEFLDEQVVIYGNPMADGSMFGSLISYRDEPYYTAHPSLYLYTAGGNYRIDVFAAHTASPAMANYPIWFSDAAERTSYIEAAKAQSSIKPDVTIPADAKLVCLVTTSDFDSGANSRFVVHGFLTAV